jgi:hypothetical protein
MEGRRVLGPLALFFLWATVAVFSITMPYDTVNICHHVISVNVRVRVARSVRGRAVLAALIPNLVYSTLDIAILRFFIIKSQQTIVFAVSLVYNGN